MTNLKIKLLLVQILIFNSEYLFPLNAENSMENPRIKYTINEQWRFSSTDNEKAIQPDFDDSDWEIVNLPHTWNKEDAFDENTKYRRGTGWYRKVFTVDSNLKDKKIFICFEGANQVADVYINGFHSGQHTGGYTAFVFEITDQLRFDQQNILAVKVDNSHHPDIPPLNADFTFYGGIYRDVWLIITEQVYIDVTNYASPGIFIDTPEISEKEGKIRIRGTILNAKNEEAQIKITNLILDQNNYEVKLLQSEMSVPANSKKLFIQDDIVDNPHLWSPENPYLYKVVTGIYEVKETENMLVDKIENPLGFRWFNYDFDKGFFLNGNPYKLSGTNRHQDYEGYGNALPDSLHRRDVQIIKENGFNFLRLAHYPQDPSVLDASDEAGLIVWEEIPVVNKITISQEFSDNCERMLIEMIRQHYNHPSIFMWGYMNEVMLIKPESPPPGYYEEIVKLAEHLESIVKKEDPYRSSVMALSYGEIENETGIDEVSDILGMNLYFGWYYEKLETFGEFLDGYHSRHPGRPIIISEYGAGSDERVHTNNPVAFDFSTEFQQVYHESTFRQIKERDYILGSAVWNQFDFGSNHRQDSKPLINQKGLYYFDRSPKDISYFYKAHLLKGPVLHIASRDWKYRTVNHDDNNQQILIYSNLDSVTLFLNDSIVGIKEITNCSARFSVNLKDGINILKAAGKKNNITFEDIAEINNKIITVKDGNITINCGAHYDFIDESFIVWKEDQSYKAKNWGFPGGEKIRTHHRILETDEEPLYQSALIGVQQYKFDVPDGNYLVQLCLAEIQYDYAGERTFNIYVNDIPVFINLDLANEYGKYIAVNRTTNIFSENNEGITIRFESVKGSPIINGIKIQRIR
jgi:beta-galactosidase